MVQGSKGCGLCLGRPAPGNVLFCFLDTCSFASWTADLGKSLLVFGSPFLTSLAGLSFSREARPVEREHITSQLLRCR